MDISSDAFESEVLKAEGPVLVDFWAEWCGPCRMQSRILEETALPGVTVFKCNVDENPDLAERFGVQSIPTLIVFRNGEIADKAIGVRSAAELRRMLSL